MSRRFLLATLLAFPSPLSGCPGGDDDDTADDDDSTSDDDDSSAELEVLGVSPGAACPPQERLGAVTIWSDGFVSGSVLRAPLPLVGLPSFDAGDCTLHVYDAGACGVCPPDTFCRGDGECVPYPAPFLDLQVQGGVGAAAFLVEADSLGSLFGAVDVAAGPFDVTLRLGGVEVTVLALRVLGALPDLDIVVQVSDAGVYGDLDMSWTPPSESGLVRTEIPINHHAQPGTFGDCKASGDSGAMRAPAEVIAPLSVITGLEFQGLTHRDVVRIDTTLGCIEVAAGTTQYQAPREE